ncbi:MAG: hypothetical protein GC179_16885 [Anaerolineaceae bacterium]|nr:hypothetical protein [Anaerolineaceae bacterium]
MADSTNFEDALEAFEKQVLDNINQLSSKDTKTRMKAAAWLGEAGDPTAITALMRVYKGDADPKVRATAQYSLGMFRKLEEELNQPDQSKVQKLLEDVAVRGKMGRRVPIPVRSLVKFEIAMIISAVLVAVLALVLPSIFRQQVSQVVQPNETVIPTALAPTAPAVASKTRPEVIADLQSTLKQVSDNSNTLQSQFQLLQNGGALDCKAYFNLLIPVALSEENSRDFPDLVTIATDINNLEASFRSAKATFEQGCQPNAALDATTVSTANRDILALVQSIANTQTALTTAAAKPA